MLNPENETRTGVFTFADIIIARFRKGAEVTLDDARANVALCLQRNAGRRRPLLVDLREVKSQTAEARAYLAGREGLQVSQAVGLLRRRSRMSLTDSGPSRRVRRASRGPP